MTNSDSNRRRTGLLSVILFSYQSEARLEGVTREVLDFMDLQSIPVELIIIDDGSTDDSAKIAERLAEQNDRVEFYELSRNFTTNYAKFAGLQVCRGDCAVFVPDDLQRPLSTIEQMYRLWCDGHQIIFDYRISRDDGVVSDAFSSIYYRIMNRFSGITYPPGGTDGFLADREIIDLINQRIRPNNTSIVVEALRLGFSPTFIPSERPKTGNKSRWTMAKKWRLAKDTFFASSSFPIKLITYLGMSTMVFCSILIVLLIYVRFWGENTFLGFRVPGWTTTLIFITLFNGLILFSLGLLAEYIWRIYEEVKDRPAFIIKKKNGKTEGKARNNADQVEKL